MIVQLVRKAQSPLTAALLGASTSAFMLIAFSAHAGGMAPLCGAFSGDALLALGRTRWLVFDPLRWAAEWLAMFCAMMLPLLVQPVDHIMRTTLRRRLPRSLAAFILCYALAWLPAAALINVAAAVLRWSVYPAVLAIATLAGALVWSASPPAQAARNRAHRLMPLEIRGIRADRDCCRFGLVTGSRCAVACWPWMLLSQTVYGGAGAGVGAMLAVTAVLVAERAMPPRAPRWQLPRVIGFLVALRPYRDFGRL